MFAKKPPPEPNLSCVPPTLRLSASGQLISISQKAPNDRIAHATIAQAFRESAEQIRLTPNENGTVVHYLIGSNWNHTMTLPVDVAPGVTTAFKTLAGLPVWEHRMALAGLLLVRCGEQDYDVALEIVPTRHGEKLTLRIEAARL